MNTNFLFKMKCKQHLFYCLSCLSLSFSREKDSSNLKCVFDIVLKDMLVLFDRLHGYLFLEKLISLSAGPFK